MAAARGHGWRREEVIDLLEIWGSDSIQRALLQSHRNKDVFEEISRGLEQCGHFKTTEECQSKTKNMCQAYKNVFVHNGKSGNSPLSCPFFEELQMILKGDPNVKKRHASKGNVRGSRSSVTDTSLGSSSQTSSAHTTTSTAILRVTSTTSQEITPPTPVQKCPILISVVFACAGLVLATAVVLWFVIQEQKRRTSKRKADEENPKKTECCSIPFENQSHKGSSLPGEDNFVLLRCPHSNDTSHGITLKDDSSKRIGSDVTEAASLSSCDEKNNHTIPLPATELGATVLVTTKTTQENFIKKELP